MSDVIEATFENGVFKPDRSPALTDSTRVRLDVEVADDQGNSTNQRLAWAALEELWRSSRFDSQRQRLTREALHERRCYQRIVVFDRSKRRAEDNRWPGTR